MNNGMQTNKSEYHKDTLASELKKSCLSKVILLVAVILLLLLAAKMTIPSDDQMMYGTLDGICQCIQKRVTECQETSRTTLCAMP